MDSTEKPGSLEEKQEDQAKCNSPSPPDGGYGWVVLAGSFIFFFIADGWAYSFGVLFPEIVEFFDESRGSTAMIVTLLYAVPMIVSPFACALVSVYGSRIMSIIGGIITSVSLTVACLSESIATLCVIIGLLQGIGLALVYISAIFVVTVYFEKRRGLATGIAVTGSGIGALVFPPVIEKLIDAYSWRGAVLISGGFCFNLAAVGVLFHPLVSKSVDSTGGLCCRGRKHRFICMEALLRELKRIFKQIFNRTTFVSFPFHVFCLANFVLFLWISMPYVYIVDYAKSIKVDDQWYAAFILSIMGLGRMTGQLVFGVLGDVKQLSPPLLFGIGCMIAGLSTAVVPLCPPTYGTLAAYAVFFGGGASVTYVLAMISLVKILGLERAVNAYGCLQLVQGLATLVGTPVAGIMYDRLQSYQLCFHIAGVMMIASGLLIVPVVCVKRCRRTATSRAA